MTGDDEIDDAIFRKMFDKFDNDGSGLISKDELSMSVRELNPKITKEELDEIIGNALFNEAGQLTYENFVDIVKKWSIWRRFCCGYFREFVFCLIVEEKETG